MTETETAVNRLGKVSKTRDCHKSKTTLCLGWHCSAVGLTVITFFHTMFIYHVREAILKAIIKCRR